MNTTTKIIGIEEKDHLEKIAQVSLYAAGVNTETIKYCYKVFSRYFNRGSALELGPAEGVMTELLASRFEDLTLVDGAKTFCDDLSQKYPKARVIHSIFEEYKPDRSFDNIILGHVLEHVNNPKEIVSIAKTWLAPNGKILAAVPNSRSVHRQVAVDMHILENETSLNEMDIHHGHRRIFSPESFREIFSQKGLKIEFFGGYWLKPVSNSQIEKTWSSEMLNSFMRLGERYPDIAGEIYVIASKKNND
jgi:2-polyprenyl-3-methyl-5-hydroxy-6-metoxy-1,4-benzoquinol methylase